MKNLIIVESPTKARTIGQYLGKEYEVLSSQGHVRDLPKNDLGVKLDETFRPVFETKRTKLVAQLRDAAKRAKTVYLATDHDREGEAIAYDLYTVLHRANGGAEFARLIFNEITKPAILEAIHAPTEVDANKVEAQRTRRILDRLMGYLISPLLSRTVAGNRFAGLSAGRVQSVALRFLCDREAEISRFVPAEYWEVDAVFEGGESWTASVTREAGEKISLQSSDDAERVESVLQSQACIVESVEEKSRKRSPAAPFITSSLQQTASSALGFTPKRTMRVAQELYEGIDLPEGTQGLITYMRTDSVRMAEEAVQEARALVKATYGESYLCPKERTYKNKKRAQDAHEAIRPTDVGRVPADVAKHLTDEQRRLYNLIYNRFLATQMADAVYRPWKIVLASDPYTLEASGSTLAFDGFLKVLPDSRSNETALPADVKTGLSLSPILIEKRQKFTEPPRRYSEAGLVNLLEREGVGRPSTYAAIVSVIQDRGYAVRQGGSLRPTLLGLMVADFLRQFFAETVDPTFTAHLEEDLDRIEEGEMSRLEALNEFYGPFSERLAALEARLEAKEEKLFQVPSDVVCEECGAPMEVRFWKGSHFLGCSRYPECRNTLNLPPDLDVKYDEDGARLREALEEATNHSEPNIPCPTCGSEMEIRTGRYGRYYRCTDPECQQTAPISTGVPCPSCHQGTLIEKYSTKRRRAFYSCDRYPKCRFATSDRPVRLCPACDEGVLVEKRDVLQCTNKNCGHQEEVDGEATLPPPEA